MMYNTASGTAKLLGHSTPFPPTLPHSYPDSLDLLYWPLVGFLAPRQSPLVVPSWVSVIFNRCQLSGLSSEVYSFNVHLNHLAIGVKGTAYMGPSNTNNFY